MRDRATTDNPLTPQPETASAWRRWIPPIVALAIFALVLAVINRELAEFHLRDVLAYLRQIPACSVLAATGATLCSYLLLSVYDLLGLRYAQKPLRYRVVAFNSVIAYAIGHSLGAAALTGGAVRYRLYSRSGLSGVDVATLQGFCSATTAVGLTILIGVSLITAPQAFVAELHMSQPWPGIVGIALLAMIAAYVAWGSFTEGGLEFRGWVLRPPGPALTFAQVVTGAFEISISAVVLWFLLPTEGHVNFLSFLGIYALAVAAGIASYLPGGIGVFESVILVALPGAPADHVLGALLGYRAIYYLLPLLLAGVAFAGFEIKFQGPRLVRFEAAAARVIAPIAPQLGGALIFLAGVVLLISGATPGIDQRLGALRHVLPLPLLELSHLAGSVTGLGLLVLSRALFRRVREGYRLTVWLLAAGIVASMLKGLDFEEASLLAIVLAVLWLGRSAFHRSASLVDERLTPVWIVSIAGVLAAVVWIGIFAHRHVEYSTELWWTFAASGDMPRALRASLVVILSAGAFFALDLLRPARPEPERPDAGDLERARRVIAESGTTLANAALTGDKRLLFSPDDDGFIMYQVAGRSWIALGDPVGDPGRGEELAWRFRELADRYGGWTVFYQVSSEWLPLYIELGLTPIKIGEEARVPLQDFDLEGSARADLRQAHRRALRDGATVEVVAQGSAEAESLLPALRRISDSWLQEKATAEKGFSVGSFDEAYLRHFPLAVVRREGEPVAFANLWTATLDELSIDLMRFGPDAPRSAMDFLFVELMLWGRQRGYRWFGLGMAPLSGLEQHPLAPSWNRVGGFIYRHGEHFYNFDGLRHYKAKFAPTWESRYLASPGGWTVMPRILLDISTLIAGGVRGLLFR